MSKKLDWTYEKIQNVNCRKPPIGYLWDGEKFIHDGVHSLTGSNVYKEQYWQPFLLPDNWKKLRIQEEVRRESNPEYYDYELQNIRDKWWKYRLHGMWFYNDGEPTYVTGTHWFYLNCIDIGNRDNYGLPFYWDSDREFFIFLEEAMTRDQILGVNLITKRRSGKTAKSVAFTLEPFTRSKDFNVGVQSKTTKDAKETVYINGILKAFVRLPDFFKPIYDTSGGARPLSGITLKQQEKKGREALKMDFSNELGGWLTWESSNERAYDGKRLNRVVQDEIFKLEDVSVKERTSVLEFCCKNHNGDLIGKMLNTSTVEEIKGNLPEYREFYMYSNQLALKDTDKELTPSRLWTYFLPSDLSRNRDKYGRVDRNKNYEEIIEERKRYESSPKALLELMRKEPLTIEEAFRASGDGCVFNATALSNRIDYLSWTENSYTKRYNMRWLNGDMDSGAVELVESENGRFKIVESELPDESFKPNNKALRGNHYTPSGMKEFVVGVDPYDHKGTEDGRGSNGSFYVMKRNTSLTTGLTNSFILQYIDRPSPRKFYEDVLKAAVYFNAYVLFESQKTSIMHFFEEWGYYGYLIHMKGRNNPGIPSTKTLHGDIVDLWEDYIDNQPEKIFFIELLEQLLEFDPDNTTKFDAVMASGVTLIADRYLSKGDRKHSHERLHDAGDIFGL